MPQSETVSSLGSVNWLVFVSMSYKLSFIYNLRERKSLKV
jgi:hypothetical protein